MRERQKKKKGRTWAEAAKTVLEKYPNTPMSHKEILQVIQRERLKEISGTSPLACLNAMLHTNSRGDEGIFYKVPGRMGVYTLKKDISEGVKKLSEEGSDESSDNLSDSRSSENSSTVPPEGRRGRWMRRAVPSKLQSQPSSPQPQCSSPPVSSSKLISPSQKHSKKALKQALKQQQQRNQRRQGGIPAISSSRLLLKTIKDMAENITTKTDVGKRLESGDHLIRRSNASYERRADVSQQVIRFFTKVPQRSDRLSAGQIKRTKCKIDVETPDSILVNTNLRALINKHTFSVLPPDCQQKLVKLLPEVDRQACLDGLLKVTSSALNNEFFASAAQSWKERLAEGEFTPELQVRMRQEIEKEKKVEHWKEAFFENYYGENSGLSYEESKELIKPNGNKEPVRRRSPVCQTNPAAQLLEDKKSAKDCVQTDATTRDKKPAEKSPDPPKELPRHKESVPATEPMKTRRSQHAEDRKLSAATQTGPVMATAAAKTLESEKPAERSPTGTLHEKQQTEEKDEEKKPPESPVKKSPPLKPIADVKDDQLVTAARPAAGDEEVASEPGAASDAHKRKTLSETEGEVTPEKRPRLSSVSSVSSVSSASSISSPATPSPTSQRVPPLKIPVSRILPVPLSPSQVSPKTPLQGPLSSPGHTGARTLAYIKAKAQLARAQRVAAAAVSSASKGTVPGPGPGGGSGGDHTQPSPSPSLSPTSPQACTRLPATSSSNQSSGLSPPLSSRPADDRQSNHFTSTVHQSSNASVEHSSVQTEKDKEAPTSAASLTRTSSCIHFQEQVITTKKLNVKKNFLLTAAEFRSLIASLESPPSCSHSRRLRSHSAHRLPSPPSIISHWHLVHFAHVKDDQLVTAARPAAGDEEVASEPGAASDAHKRKTLSETEGEVTPEKRPRLSSVSSVSSVSSASSISSPATPSPTSQRVPPLKTEKDKEAPTSAASLTRTSSCIPANNPLVTQLLQGKEVPLDQILPKPLSSTDIRVSGQASGSKGKTTHFVDHKGDRHVPPQANTAVRAAECTKHHRELPDKETQEQILQTLMQRKAQQQSQPPGGSGPLPAHHRVPQMLHPQECREQSRVLVGFLGRRKIPKPAMTGHYLLNVSTYGRGSESRRLQLSVCPNKSALERESTDGKETAKTEEPAKKDLVSVTRVKTEQQGCAVTRANDPASFQHCSGVKTEPGSESNGAGGADNGVASAKAKDSSPFSPAHRNHLELRNNNQGNSEPYLTLMDPGHQQLTAFQRTLDNQESAVASSYGGTISMSVPHTLNHSTAGTASSAPSSEVDGGGICGSVMSFSVTVTTIPAGHALDHSNQGEPSREQSFIEGANMEDVQSKCYCRLKAMIMCKGCGAFCHDDCIGPSKLCVSCLVVQ
uniref:ASXL transcriptional regulator 2 n=1 Tax=Poecilia formosa TaxID=48698 RepID=A0A087YIJ9_POEFO